eukprot:gnl/TRDRNA2_/TRDRNA2_29591_c0_seq1.p1 gnl/TRDRNA2_/TRDRNA2_29591_c0~~gnl/TRDRNA2_/TRDRNA2_29591_c0_seq1.p1  ORF type:complete len:435 (-),score=63.47 gnl/TRDRNA2_/TRDRNA2_29591_c0_seq1:144-1448(-)
MVTQDVSFTMAYSADDVPTHEYSVFGDDAAVKATRKPCKAIAVVCSMAIALFMYLAVVECIFERQPAKVNLQHQAISVAEQAKKMMSHPEYAAEAKLLAHALKAAARDEGFQQHVQLQAMSIDQQMRDLMADPEFVQGANQVAEHMKALTDAPIVQAETSRIAELVRTASAQDSELLGRRLSAGQLVQSSAGGRLGDKASRDLSSMVARAAKPRRYTPILRKLGDAKVATVVSEAQLLSSLEKGGVFSQLEKAGAFSSAEKLLPIVDDLGLLKSAQETIDSKPGDLFATGAALIALGPIYNSLASQDLLPSIEGVNIPGLVPGVLFTGTTAAGVLYLVLSNIVGQLEDPKALGRTIGDLTVGVSNPPLGLYNLLFGIPSRGAADLLRQFVSNASPEQRKILTVLLFALPGVALYVIQLGTYFQSRLYSIVPFLQ